MAHQRPDPTIERFVERTYVGSTDLVITDKLLGIRAALARQ